MPTLILLPHQRLGASFGARHNWCLAYETNSRGERLYCVADAITRKPYCAHGHVHPDKGEFVEFIAARGTDDGFCLICAPPEKRKGQEEESGEKKVKTEVVDITGEQEYVTGSLEGDIMHLLNILEVDYVRLDEISWDKREQVYNDLLYIYNIHIQIEKYADFPYALAKEYFKKKLTEYIAEFGPLRADNKIYSLKKMYTNSVTFIQSMNKLKEMLQYDIVYIKYKGEEVEHKDLINYIMGRGKFGETHYTFKVYKERLDKMFDTATDAYYTQVITSAQRDIDDPGPEYFGPDLSIREITLPDPNAPLLLPPRIEKAPPLEEPDLSQTLSPAGIPDIDLEPPIFVEEEPSMIELSPEEQVRIPSQREEEVFPELGSSPPLAIVAEELEKHAGYNKIKDEIKTGDAISNDLSGVLRDNESEQIKMFARSYVRKNIGSLTYSNILVNYEVLTGDKSGFMVPAEIRGKKTAVYTEAADIIDMIFRRLYEKLKAEALSETEEEQFDPDEIIPELAGPSEITPIRPATIEAKSRYEMNAELLIGRKLENTVIPLSNFKGSLYNEAAAAFSKIRDLLRMPKNAPITYKNLFDAHNIDNAGMIEYSPVLGDEIKISLRAAVEDVVAHLADAERAKIKRKKPAPAEKVPKPPQVPPEQRETAPKQPHEIVTERIYTLLNDSPELKDVKFVADDNNEVMGIDVTCIVGTNVYNNWVHGAGQQFRFDPVFVKAILDEMSSDKKLECAQVILDVLNALKKGPPPTRPPTRNKYAEDLETIRNHHLYETIKSDEILPPDEFEDNEDSMIKSMLEWYRNRYGKYPTHKDVVRLHKKSRANTIIQYDDITQPLLGPDEEIIEYMVEETTVKNAIEAVISKTARAIREKTYLPREEEVEKPKEKEKTPRAKKPRSRPQKIQLPEEQNIESPEIQEKLSEMEKKTSVAFGTGKNLVDAFILASPVAPFRQVDKKLIDPKYAIAFGVLIDKLSKEDIYITYADILLYAADHGDEIISGQYILNIVYAAYDETTKWYLSLKKTREKSESEEEEGEEEGEGEEEYIVREESMGEAKIIELENENRMEFLNENFDEPFKWIGVSDVYESESYIVKFPMNKHYRLVHHIYQLPANEQMEIYKRLEKKNTGAVQLIKEYENLEYEGENVLVLERWSGLNFGQISREEEEDVDQTSNKLYLSLGLAGHKALIDQSSDYYSNDNFVMWLLDQLVNQVNAMHYSEWDPIKNKMAYYGYIHGDLEPRNVLYDMEGEEVDAVSINDMSKARNMEDFLSTNINTEPSDTLIGHMKGTFAISSLEHAYFLDKLKGIPSDGIPDEVAKIVDSIVYETEEGQEYVKEGSEVLIDLFIFIRILTRYYFALIRDEVPYTLTGNEISSGLYDVKINIPESEKERVADDEFDVSYEDIGEETKMRAKEKVLIMYDRLINNLIYGYLLAGLLTDDEQNRMKEIAAEQEEGDNDTTETK